MAHTPRSSNEKRRHPAFHKIGSSVGMWVTDANGQPFLAKGKVNSTDEGGWIYVSFQQWPTGIPHVPSHMRSTNVFQLEA